MSHLLFRAPTGVGSHRPGRSRWRALLIAPCLVLAAARCANDSMPAGPIDYADPVTAQAAIGETLSSVKWNQVAQELIGKNRPNQNAAWRSLTYVSLAQHVALERTVSGTRSVTRPMIRGAVAGASAMVLAYLFPVDSQMIETVVRSEEDALPEGHREWYRLGERMGREVGAATVARAKADRFAAVWSGTIPTGPGKWSSLASPPAPPLLPLGGEVVPFFLRGGDQFRPAPPPSIESPAFRDALDEVRRIAASRTAEQDSLAKFWALPTGSLVVGYWNNTALALIARERLSERGTARSLALMNMAGMDALTACHDAKYAYWFWRPSSADPSIKTSTGVPNHPSYPSNHSCISGASAHVLGALFPHAREQLLEKATEASRSRLYGGIHYRFDLDAGMEIARKVAALAVESERAGRVAGMVAR
ncbi:MAG: vanadium-dependent haloperoxidase [Gemmatimonadaceae bacterium]|jgi:hypothetical protein|nr:vanadium-dependent haloperoxidase [Gemmatimonadaceae bacterium]